MVKGTTIIKRVIIMGTSMGVDVKPDLDGVDWLLSGIAVETVS